MYMFLFREMAGEMMVCVDLEPNTLNSILGLKLYDFLVMKIKRRM